LTLEPRRVSLSVLRAKPEQRGIGMIREAAVLLFAACLTGSAVAAPDPSPRLVPMTLSGTIGEESGSALPGAAVRVYQGARLAGAAVADSSGNYRLEFAIDPTVDETVLVWWVSPRTDLVSEVAIVRESARDLALGLWGPCVSRIGALREQSRSVRLLGPMAVRRRLADDGCAR
jgi:hypothetical protein